LSVAVLVGTCSWTDPTLLACGRLYLPGANTAEARLRYYASQFSLVEVDSSYYSPPQERTARVWASRTPAGFRFDVKAFRLFTHHPTPQEALPADVREELPAELRQKENVYLREMPGELVEELWRRFEAAVQPLGEAGKLGAVVFQFPPWFRPGRDSAAYLASLGEKVRFRAAVEFRNGAWLGGERRRETVLLLRGSNLAYVCVDEPQGFASSVPPVVEVTREDLAVVRFHGRNRETWEKKGITAAERFDYLYGEEELKEWVPRVRELAGSAREVHVLFNNCHQDKAVVNARQMLALLGLV
jgi:uncharacterized protein YecE (DUF72 family)